MCGDSLGQEETVGAKYSVRSASVAASLLFVALLTAVTGCEPAGQQPAGSSPAARPSAGGPSAGRSLVHADGQVLNETIAKHKGKVVLVDYWATWCLPCVEGFPHTVELAKKHREAGLATIAVSFDQLDEEANVEKFLEQQGADFDCLISKYDGVSQAAANDFDVEVLPQYRLYDRQGKLRKKWEGKPDGLDEMIVELLAEPV